MKNGKIKLTEKQLRWMIAESVRNALMEYSKTKKDQMKGWFKDMDDAQKVRDTMDYIFNGGKNPFKKKPLTEIVYGNDYPEGLYICSETDYENGRVDYWVGCAKDAEECEYCSEGDAIGPFDSKAELMAYARENGFDLG